MIYSRQTPITRLALKRMLANPDTATVQVLDDFLRGTRANDYLYFKNDADGCLRASSQCRTLKYTRRFEREVPEQGRGAFLVAVEMLVTVHALPGEQDVPFDARVCDLAKAVLACCGKANQWGLQNTARLKGAVALLREALDQAAAQADAQI